jgi:hypothetical protein
MNEEPCQQCIDKWGQQPSPWGDSMDELQAYDEHRSQHCNSPESRESRSTPVSINHRARAHTP